MQIKFPDFTQAKILVLGDVMLDRYWRGTTDRISPEAPVPVVRVQHVEERPGGAGNVAVNIRALGCNVSLVGLCGQDAEGQLLENKLTAGGIANQLIRVADKPTITKLRVLSLNQQLMRLDFEEGFSNQHAHSLEAAYANLLPQVNMVVLSDYAKGTISESQYFIRQAKNLSIPVVVDPKGLDFSRYRGANLLTPNQKEFEAIVGICHSEAEFIERGFKLIHELNIEALLITRGANGMTLLRPNHSEFHLPAQAREVYDVTGAGDTVIGVLAAGLAAGSSYEDAVTLANTAAGIVVGRLGAATVNAPELRRAVVMQDAIGKGALTEEQLIIAVSEAKLRGERIVMTNGCFDILHAGHVNYLKEAKRLGDRLIVAVNDDASVARLKGADRPINTLQRRMSVLSELSAVDWVVSFSEDTPKNLICNVLPDILVKGGDYAIDEIAGGDCVRANGGEVMVLQFEEGCSTSSIINSIRSKEIA